MLSAALLGTTPIVADGSMQIELMKRGLSERPSERYNLTSSAIVERIHSEFAEAGATLLQSNTLHANRYALESSMLSARVQEINRTGVWAARAAAQSRNCIVAGVMGPSGRLQKPLGPLTDADLLWCFTEQATALLAANADCILLKSFIHLNELVLAVKAVQSVSQTIPVIALKSFPEDGSVLASSFPETIAEALTSLNVAAFGSNGTVGPQRMLSIVQSLRVNNTPLVALPDIGIPTILDGVPVFNAEPTYVAEASARLVENGATIIGADGGASVEHVAAIANAVKGLTVGSTPPLIKKPSRITIDEVPAKEHTPFISAVSHRFVTTVELDIPRGLDMHSVIEGAIYLKAQGIDAVNISDGARARLRMSPVAISQIVQQTTGMECITHLACRDRNMVALQSELLGAHAMGVRNFLAVTGDPTHIGDFPSATSVYDVDSIGLVRALGSMNMGTDLMGNPLGVHTSFSISCAVNPAADNLNREIDRLAQKVEQGAQVAFTQPIFDEDLFDTFLDKIVGLDIKIMLGIIPLRTIRHAEFLHYEVPGMMIPDWVREKMKAAGNTTEQATDIGISIAVEFLQRVHNRIHGVYLMPPFKKYDIAVRILNQLRLTKEFHATN